MVKGKCFGGCSIPFMWLLGGIFLTSRFYFELVILLRNFLQEEKPLKMCFYFLIKGSSFGFGCYSDFLFLYWNTLVMKYILWWFSCLPFIEILSYLSFWSLTYLSFSLWKVSPFECCQFTQLLVRPFRYSIFTVFSNTAFLFNFYIPLQIWIIYIE